MSHVTGIFAYFKTKKRAFYNNDFVWSARSVNKTLKSLFKPDKKYYLGLDQSTTCTGITITDEEYSFAVLLDFARKSTDVETYKFQLKNLVTLLVSDLELKQIIIEQPLYIKGNHATSVLMDLKKYIKSWRNDIPEFYQVPFDTIFPQQWKEVVVNKKKGKYRTSSKAATAADICDMFPLLEEYRLTCPAKDFDSFDAFGIVYGYRRQHYSQDGNDLNYGSISYYKKIHVFLKYLPEDKLKDKEVIGAWLYKEGLFEEVGYNPKFSFYENIALMCTKYNISYFVVDPSLEVNMFWETSEIPLANHKFVCIAVRKGYLNDKKLHAAIENIGNYFYM